MMTKSEPEPDKQPAGICGLPCEVYSRVCGYLRPVQSWNKGARANYERRKTFRVDDRTPEEIDASVQRRFGLF